MGLRVLEAIPHASVSARFSSRSADALLFWAVVQRKAWKAHRSLGSQGWGVSEGPRCLVRGLHL